MFFLTAAEKVASAGRSSPSRAAKEAEELDQVAGNAEDEIGERIAVIRETELLYGPDSLLAVYGPMIVHISGSPHKFKVRFFLAVKEIDLALKNTIFVVPLIESNFTSCSNARVQQVPLRQLSFL